MEIRVLGPLELWSGDRRIAIGGFRQLSVLAVLLLEPGRPVGQDQLIDAVWGDAAPAAAESTLHSCVYRLRKALDDSSGSVLRRGPFGYSLDVPVEGIDAQRFEGLAAAGRQALDHADYENAATRLREALGLWRGAAFAGVEAAAVREQAAALDSLRLDVTEWRLAAELELGNHAVLQGELTALTSENPYRERLWELLILALYRCGRQADALEAYQRVTRLLDDELGVQPGPTLRQVRQQILAGEPEPGSLPAPKAPPEAVVPRLLPARVRDFIGRAKHLKALDAFLPTVPNVGATTVAISAVTGTAGVGKTALAIHWAHQVADRFPDGQLYVNLHGFGPSGHKMAAGEALRLLLDALGVSADGVPADVEARAGLYRSLLAGKRMLVLLDNTADEEQVRPLLPASPGCLALVTSRNQLPGLVAAEAAHPINLNLLTDTEAYDLLARRLGHDRLAAEPDATRELIDDCARLPLALAIVAARAATNPGYRLRAIADQLCDADDSLEAFTGGDASTDLPAVFSWSVDQLSVDAARLFRLLGLNPGTEIGVPAAASLADVTVQRVRTLLTELCRANLLTEPTPGRYALHDLLRAYAFELVHTNETETERRAAATRVLCHHLHTAYAAAIRLHPYRTPIALVEPEPGTIRQDLADHDEAWAWLKAEHTTLLDAVGRAHDSGFYQLAWQLGLTLADFLYRTGRWKEEVVSLRVALDAAQRLGDAAGQARILGLRSGANDKLERFDEAYEDLQQALALHLELDDTAEEALTRLHLASWLGRRDRHQEALESAQQALRVFDVSGPPASRAYALNQVGWHLAHLQEYDQALERCEQALAQAQEIGDDYQQSVTLNSLGYIHHQRGDHHTAVECFQEALDSFRHLKISYQEAVTLTQLGDAHLALGNTRTAYGSWRKAWTILDELGHPDAEQARAKLSG
ncbi:AfsR/SARP family transcriptional regulator [Flindersiella endophytica]